MKASERELRLEKCLRSVLLDIDKDEFWHSRVDHHRYNIHDRELGDDCRLCKIAGKIKKALRKPRIKPALAKRGKP